jgi:PAS domain S-box-containing protein
VSPEGTIEFWNRAAESILGHPAREVMGKPRCDVFAGSDVSGNRVCLPGCHVLTLVKMREPVRHFDILTRDRNGRQVWLNMSTLSMPHTGRGRRITLHLFRDITAARQMEALLRERLARSSAGPGQATGPASPLTRRETEVLLLMAGGAGTRKMAAALHVSPATARNHVQNILGKLGVHSRLEAVAVALAHGLVGPAPLPRPADPAGRLPVRRPDRNLPRT